MRVIGVVYSTAESMKETIILHYKQWEQQLDFRNANIAQATKKIIIEEE